jgi:uncharacterized protein (TIGR02246 family)
MRSPTLFVLLALTFTFLSCATPSEEMDVATVRKAIEETNTQFVQAFQQGDAAAVAALYTEEAVLLPPNSGIIRGRTAVEETFKSLIEMGVKDLSLTTVDVGGSGDMAYEIGRYALTVQPEGQAAMADSGKYVVVWKKQVDGSWKLHVDIWNTSLPMAAPQEPVTVKR